LRPIKIAKTAIACMLLMVSLLSWPVTSGAATETIHLPITIDYSLFRSLVSFLSFNQPGNRAIPGGQEGKCTRFELWQPEVGPDAALLKLGTNLNLQIGVPLGKNCMKLVDWQGFIEVLQRVSVDEKTMRLKLQTEDVRIYNQNKQQVPVDKNVSDLIRTSVCPFLDKISIDLSAPVAALQSTLPLFFSGNQRQTMELALSKLRPGEVRIDKDAVRLDLVTQVEAPPPLQAAAGALSAPQVEGVSKNWEDWDSYLVQQLGSLTGKTVSEGDQDSMLETLLSNRYDFTQGLQENRLTQDLVSKQFGASWQNLGMILRKHLAAAPSRSLFNYLAYFTTSDALANLRDLGSRLGLDIGRSGLTSLAGLLQPGATPAQYTYAVDPGLRSLLGFGPALENAGPRFPEEELTISSLTHGEIGDECTPVWSALAFPQAWAADQPSPAAPPEVTQWVIPQGDINPYLGQVKQVLEQAAEKTLTTKTLDEKYQALYRLLVFATAWQETCWRQFRKAEGKVRPMVSYNQSSIGLMQINERVWRGLYQVENLRWDIKYNAGAGADILHYYLRKYALRKMDPKNPLDTDTLAQTVYAMYNGGPREFYRLPKRKQQNTLYLSDRLFWEKYCYVKEGQFDKLSICLLGR
jgi:hypothetical protein